MSDAKARAEARRKAILSRGGDRLARITTSARGEDGASYMHDDPPLAALPKRVVSDAFLGDTSDMPPIVPPSSNSTGNGAHTAFQSAGLGATAPDPSVWSEEQQAQFMNALLGGSMNAASRPHEPAPQPRLTAPSHNATGAASVPPQPDADPMAALMAALQGGAPPDLSSMFPGAPPAPAAAATAPKPQGILHKVMPVVHLLAAWALLVYFIFWREPEAYEAAVHTSSASGNSWTRWADLSWRKPGDGWSVQTVPFFWAFTTLALVLHSWRVFSNLDPIQPPTLLALALPHLPPPLPLIITSGLKYIQIAGIFLDDVSALVFGVGVIIWVATWLAT